MSVATTDAAARPRRATPLAEHAHNVHSQFGEDGIVEEILRRIGRLDPGAEPLFCVEFGAWDGIQYSNTRRLIETFGARALLIEGDADRLPELRRNCEGFGGVTALHRMVGWEGDDALDAILDESDAPDTIDVLSVDIDGNDYHVLDALRRHRARVLIVEYNPSVPDTELFVQERRAGVQHGSGPRSLVELAHAKRYELAAVTATNLILVDRDLFPMLGIADNSLRALRVGLPPITYLVQGYDGTCFLAGHRRLLWHRAPMDASLVQQVPGVIRSYPDHYGPVRRAIYNLWKRRRSRVELGP